MWSMMPALLVYLTALGIVETAAITGIVVFDKTGTLTTDVPSVAAFVPTAGYTSTNLLQLAIDTLDGTCHPVANGLASLGSPSQAATEGNRYSDPGQGTRWENGAVTVLAGRHGWLRDQGIDVTALDDDGMALHLAHDGDYAGYILFEETLRPEATKTVRHLQQAGHIVYLLSGDTRRSCMVQALRLDIPAERVVSGVTPEEKHRFVQALEQRHSVAFVGDGLNDGLALASARLGIAVGTATPTARAAAAVYLRRTGDASPGTQSASSHAPEPGVSPRLQHPGPADGHRWLGTACHRGNRHDPEQSLCPAQ